MAALRAHRRSGVGARLLSALEAEARPQPLAGLVLHAQRSAVGFHQRHGYAAHGPGFREAGIDHAAMRKAFAR